MKLKSLLMLVILLFIGMAFTAPPPAEAQVYQKTGWYKNITTALDTCILQTGTSTVTVTITNEDDTSSLYVWFDSSGSSTGLDSNRFILIPPKCKAKVTGAFQKIYRKCATGAAPSQVIMGNYNWSKSENKNEEYYKSEFALSRISQRKFPIT